MINDAPENAVGTCVSDVTAEYVVLEGKIMPDAKAKDQCCVNNLY